MTDSIIFKENNGTGIILLNRPKALNALNLQMAELFLIQLKKWQKDKKIQTLYYEKDLHLFNMFKKLIQKILLAPIHFLEINLKFIKIINLPGRCF